MISAVVLAGNEAKNLAACLASLDWCDEIIVIDDFSTDRTVAIARENGALVFQHHLKNDFAGQRNFGLQKARGDWILFIDADERVSSALAAEILNSQFSILNYDGFNLKRRDFWGGHWLEHGETGRIELLRLARQGAGLWQRPVHEFWDIKGAVGELKNPLLHYPHQGLTDFLIHVNFYSDLHADTFYRQGVRPADIRIIVNPLGKFIVNWIFKLGFLDGTPGLIVALVMSFHSFLAWGKLYLKWQK